MSAEKLSPRQSMISMMYLVLLAMLAMNASKSLLNAFVMLEVGIGETVKSFTTANAGFYNTIDKAAASSSAFDKVQKDAQALKAKADEVVQIINDLKVSLVTTGEITSVNDTVGVYNNYLDDKKIPLTKDNQDFGASYLLVVEGGAHGQKLTAAVQEFRELVVQMLNNDGDESNDYLIKQYETLLFTDDAPDPNDPTVIASFASRISEHLPLAAVTANLSLYSSYVRNAEADVVSSIASKMDGSGMVVDRANGMATFDNGYVLKNDSVSGSVFIAAYNSKMNPTIYLGVPDTVAFAKAGGSGTIEFPPGSKPSIPIVGEMVKMPIKNGKGSFVKYASEVGEQTLEGVIEVVSSKGTFYYMYKSKYMVAEPSATVAATKMNVFYVGVPNPIAVSAPGVSLDEIEVSGTGGLSVRPASGKKGEFVVTAKKAAKSTFVQIKKKGGAVLGKSEFRVKRLPDPKAKILGKSEGLVSKGQLKAASFVKAEMENFDFDLKVKVVSFVMSMSVNGDIRELESKSQLLTPQMKGLLGRAKKGSKIYFEDVKAKMPDGTIRNLGSINFKVK